MLGQARVGLKVLCLCEVEAIMLTACGPRPSTWRSESFLHSRRSRTQRKQEHENGGIKVVTGFQKRGLHIHRNLATQTQTVVIHNSDSSLAQGTRSLTHKLSSGPLLRNRYGSSFFISIPWIGYGISPANRYRTYQRMKGRKSKLSSWAMATRTNNSQSSWFLNPTHEYDLMSSRWSADTHTNNFQSSSTAAHT